MQFAGLGSGSRGNATVVRADDSCVLVDCGFSAVECERRLQRLGLAASDLQAILVTHEHADHISGVAKCARKFGLPVWLTAGTHSARDDLDGVDVQLISPHVAFSIGALRVQPYPVPHDAREPCQFQFSAGGRRLGILSDAGSVTQHMRQVLLACDALMLECNHDLQMLEAGPYPQSLKLRVAGHLGHLSNCQAAALLSEMDVARLQHVVLTHLSEKNNTPALARTACAQQSGLAEDWFAVADQDQGFTWREVN